MDNQFENITKTLKGGTKDLNIHVLTSKERLQETTIKPATERHDSLKESKSFSSSTDLSSDSESKENIHSSISNSLEPSFMLIEKTIGTHSVPSLTSSIAYEGRDEEMVIYRSTYEKDNLVEDIQENTEIVANFDNIQNSDAVNINCENQQESGAERLILDENLQQFLVEEQIIRSPSEDARMQSVSESVAHSDSRKSVRSNINGATPVKSFGSPTDSKRSNGVSKSSQVVGKGKDVGIKFSQYSGQNITYSGREGAKVLTNDSKLQKLQRRICMLEGELTEAAAIEVSLYSVIAEHGSSVNKVHAPARRLSRLYLHACKEKFSSRIASAARSIISGLVLVAKACGNDVPRYMLDQIIVS